MSSGFKDEKICLLIANKNIEDERIFSLLNDLLETGEVTGLLTHEDIEMIDTINKDQPMKQFVDRIRKNLHVVFTVSTMSLESFKERAQHFPGLTKNMQMSWFRPWTQEQLQSISEKIMPDLDPQNRETVVNFMSFAYFRAIEIAQAQNVKSSNFSLM